VYMPKPCKSKISSDGPTPTFPNHPLSMNRISVNWLITGSHLVHSNSPPTK
jgi:hypothetical protein